MKLVQSNTESILPRLNDITVDQYPLKPGEEEVFIGGLPKARTRDEIYKLLNFSTKTVKEPRFRIYHRRFLDGMKHGLANIIHFKVPKICEEGKNNPGYAFIVTTKLLAERLLEEAKHSEFYYYDEFGPVKSKGPKNFYKLDIKPIDREKRLTAEKNEFFKEVGAIKREAMQSGVRLVEPDWFSKMSEWDGNHENRRNEKIRRNDESRSGNNSPPTWRNNRSRNLNWRNKTYTSYSERIKQNFISYFENQNQVISDTKPQKKTEEINYSNSKLKPKGKSLSELGRESGSDDSFNCTSTTLEFNSDKTDFYPLYKKYKKPEIIPSSSNQKQVFNMISESIFAASKHYNITNGHEIISVLNNIMTINLVH